MSHEILEERVGKLETGFGHLRTEVAVQSRDINDLKTQSAAILAGIQELKHREASRPPPTSWKQVWWTLLGSASGLAGVAAIVWYIVGSSPVVVDIRERMLKLDDPVVGRVTRMEAHVSKQGERLERLEGWRPQVQTNR